MAIAVTQHRFIESDLGGIIDDIPVGFEAVGVAEFRRFSDRQTGGCQTCVICRDPALRIRCTRFENDLAARVPRRQLYPHTATRITGRQLVTALVGDADIDAVYNMLFGQVKTQSRFKYECNSCHGTAAEFVRKSLERRDGVLYCRDSEYQARLFLDNHRDLNPDDVEFFINVLTRIAHEVYRP